MEWAGTTLAFYGLGAAALATSLVTLRRRLELSKAKHRTLTGHARMARRVAALVPFYGYDEDRFFCSDDAPEEIVSRRRAGFKRLAALYDTHFAETIRLTAAVTDGISDLQFTDAYRVPFQYGGVVRRHLKSPALDRKSTRLNSSHSQISYAVFCLKKKKQNQNYNGDQKKETTSYS